MVQCLRLKLALFNLFKSFRVASRWQIPRIILMILSVVPSFNAEGDTAIIYAWHPTSDALQYHATQRGTADATTGSSEKDPDDVEPPSPPPAADGDGAPLWGCGLIGVCRGLL